MAEPRILALRILAGRRLRGFERVGANDIPMITSAGLGIGYYPHPAAGEAAAAVIRHHDLTALLWAQGYSRRQWVMG